MTERGVCCETVYYLLDFVGYLVAAAVVNLLDHRPAAVVGWGFFAAVLFAALAIGETVAYRKCGEPNRCTRWLGLAAFVLLVLGFIVVLLVSR